MSHERSETVSVFGPRVKYRNVYGPGTGKEGQRLPALYPWENDNDFDTLEDAINAAKRRSQDQNVPGLEQHVPGIPGLKYEDVYPSKHRLKLPKLDMLEIVARLLTMLG